MNDRTYVGLQLALNTSPVYSLYNWNYLDAQMSWCVQSFLKELYTDAQMSW